MHSGNDPALPDVLVVGGGVAGLAAARAAADAGATTLLLDDRRRHRSDGEPAPDVGNASQGALARAATSAGAALRLDTSVWGCFAGLIVTATDPTHTFTLRPRRLVLATGSHDVPGCFPGSSLPGVVAGSHILQAAMHSAELRGHRYAVIGTADEAEWVANAIMGMHGDIVARGTGEQPVRAEGRERVEAVWIGEDRVPCDMIVLAGRQAASELARMAGCRVSYHPYNGGFIPRLDSRRQATVEGIFIAGDAAGPCGAEVAIAEGRLAALGAAASLGFCGEREVDAAWQELRSLAPERFVQPAAERSPFALDDDTIIVCPCEMISAGTIRGAIQRGASSINDVKRRTRAGMGPCQGRSCMVPIAQLLHAEGTVPYDAIQPMTARPPVRPISLGQLAALDGTDVAGPVAPG